MNNQEYNEYLKTKHWKDTRAKAKKRANNMCCKCLTKDNLEVHHTNYTRLYDEADDDLMVLCRACHQAEHDEIETINAKRLLKTYGYANYKSLRGSNKK